MSHGLWYDPRFWFHFEDFKEEIITVDKSYFNTPLYCYLNLGQYPHENNPKDNKKYNSLISELIRKGERIYFFSRVGFMKM